MGWFDCPTCETLRHIDTRDDDNWVCSSCGTPVADDEMSGTPIIVDGPHGKRYIRPDNGCYSCDVKGPRCLWHAHEWVEDPETVPKTVEDQ